MRIRSIKPEFWRDRALASLAADVRLFYIGLWQEADDAGWLRWDLAEIGADLYPYRPAHSRERQLVNYSDALVALPGAPRLVIHACGHAQITRLTGHQRQSGKPVTTIHREHANQCAGLEVPGPGANAKAAAVEHETAAPKHSASGSPRKPAARKQKPDTGGEVRGGVPTEREGKEGEGGRTNGVATTSIDQAVLIAADLSKDPKVREVARSTVRKYAPERLSELAALDPDTDWAAELTAREADAAPPAPAARPTARPRGAARARG
jgi:hypothetical protein